MSDTTRRTFLKVSGAALGGIAVGTQVTAAERTDRFIVELKGGRLPRDLEVIHEMPGVDFAVVRGSESAVKRSGAVKDYAPDIEVQLDDPDVNAKAPTVEDTSVDDEPYYPLQWDKQALDIETAHETTMGEDSSVAIIDTGVAAAHPDLNVNEQLSRNFTGDGLGAGVPAGGYHGTHVAGIVAAQDNGQGVIGTAPETTLVDCRVFSTGLGASFGDILMAIVYSANMGVDAANLSLGAYPIPRQALGAFYGATLNRIMTYANKQGTLLVIAAGNDAVDLQHDKNFISLPNEGAQAVSVSATGPLGFLHGESGFESPPETPARYTNFGTNAITIGAPGGNYDPDFPPGWYFDLVFNTFFSGTGTPVSGIFGPDAETYRENPEFFMSSQFVGTKSDDILVSVTGNPPVTESPSEWYNAVGLGGVRFDFDESKGVFSGDEVISVEYEDQTHSEKPHERPKPDWIAFYLGDGEDVTHIAIDWWVDVASGKTLSWNEDEDPGSNDEFGDGYGGVFAESSVPDIFNNELQNQVDASTVLGNTEIMGVGVFSGDGLNGDESIDIFYKQVTLEGEPLLEPDYTYGWVAGTSMASPQVAGAAALVKSTNPNYNANQIESALKRAAEVPEDYDKTYYGSGFLNINDAV